MYAKVWKKINEIMIGLWKNYINDPRTNFSKMKTKHVLSEVHAKT